MNRVAWTSCAFYIFLICGAVGVLVDLDHIWSMFGILEPITFTGWYSRPFHTALIFIMVGFIASGIITALTNGSKLGKCLELLDKRIERRISPMVGCIFADIEYHCNNNSMVVKEFTGGEVERMN